MKTKVFFILIAAFCFSGDVFAQTDLSALLTATLQSRVKTDEKDNYVDATFSFEKGVNGEHGKLLTRNDWDLQFNTARKTDGTPVQDYFDVTMVTDDCSRIKDLGKFEWTDQFEIPVLVPFERPDREKSVDAKLGHIYLVHTKDRDSDLYAIFRVEEMKSGESVTISWKLISAPTEKNPD